MSTVYPASPTDVPADLTAPSANYRRHAWLAVAGLAVFVALYFALAGWFGWTAWRLLSGLFRVGSDNFILNLAAGVCSAFLAVFMLKALVFVKQGQDSEDLEVTAAEQPQLFEFLNRLAAEAGAPRPHRVYVSARVNAAVFYDLSIANLLLPSRKNLEIGLGLVNVLTLGELKAVLAHEFGHFAQKTMAVGRWVYIAQQIAGHIVARRDALDAFLNKLCRVDIRIAWIGYVLRIIIWSIRSLVDLMFRAVVIAQRALSREMEFQADLVAVSVTGSDALIHALHKLNAADEAWDRTLSFAGSELQEKRGVQDLFAVQLRVIEHVRALLGEPGYGVVPPVPDSQPESHRVFKVALAAPPKMWATHPANSDREANAKRRYVRAGIDDRSAWVLFENPQALRERVSAHVVRKAELQPAAIEISLTKLDEQYARGFFKSQYRGSYLGRSIVRHARSVDELYAPLPQPERLKSELESVYPESLSTEIERLRTLEEERQMLIALREGMLTAPGGVISHRGITMSRKELPKAIEAVEKEVAACAESVRTHDRRCRAAHLCAAKTLGEDWASYLKGLLNLLHYADHVEANLLDAHGLLSHTVGIATADGKVSSGELARIVHAADTLYSALKDVHDAADKVIPDRSVLERMKAESWSAELEKLNLPAPSNANISDWLNVAGSWVRAASMSLASLRLAALEQLLATEAEIAGFVSRGTKSPGAAPSPAVVPREYRLLMPGSERPRKDRLTWWDRFQTASGLLPTVARLGVAAGIIGAVLWAAGGVGATHVHVFNGLYRPVITSIHDTPVSVGAGSHVSIDVGQADHLHIVTTTQDGAKIEEFDADTVGGSTRDVYNIAGAGALMSWVAVYGGGNSPSATMLGAPRWSQRDADYFFEEPPASINTKSGSARRDVITGFGITTPQRVLSFLPKDPDRDALIAAHARWDGIDSPYIQTWLNLAASQPNFSDIISARLQEQPTEPLFLRVEQDMAIGAAFDAVCEKHRKLAAGAPNDSNLQYIATRCIVDLGERHRVLLDLQQRWPENGWLQLAAGFIHASEANWQSAMTFLDNAETKLPSMREQLVMEEVRIQRMLSGGLSPELQKLSERTEYARYLLSIETEQGLPSDPRAPYIAMARGELNSALETVSQEEHARILRLVAASDGAQTAVIERALALSPDAGLDSDTFLPSLSLAVRNGRDVSALREHAPKIYRRDADKMLAAFDAVRNRADQAKIESMLKGLDPRLRGHVYVAAAMLRGSDCPQEWRAAAKRLLFAPERPFIR